MATMISSAVTAAPSPAPSAPLGPVDFRYPPPWWQTLLCLPDDPDKPLVGKEGQFFFDYGGRGPRKFSTSVGFDLEGGLTWKSQAMPSALIPVLETAAASGPIEVRQTAFLETPDADSDVPPMRIERVGEEIAVAGHDGPRESRSEQGWAKPPAGSDPAFANIALGRRGSPVDYRLVAPPGGRSTVVVGLCEGKWDVPGQRLLRISIEGDTPRKVDPVADFGKNVPGLYEFSARDLNGDGVIEIRVDSTEGADRNAILNALWAFTGPAPDREKILSGQASETAYAYAAAGTARYPARRYVLQVELKNPTEQPISARPLLRLNGEYTPTLQPDGALFVGPRTRLLAEGGIETVEAAGENQWLARLPAMEVPAKGVRLVTVSLLRSWRGPAVALTSEQAGRKRDQAATWWNTKSNLPKDVVQVPDSGIQDMLTSCVRNIWQSREIRNGHFAFFVGPTSYRQLWLVDGAFLLETAALLGRPLEARAGVEYEMSFQDPDGGFSLKKAFWKEDGLVLWTAIRHAILTNDQPWLRRQWPRLERIVAHIQSLRKQASVDPNAANFGLLPPGDVDGGISYDPTRAEYSNVMWNLIGLKDAIEAAHWLKEDDTAVKWQAEYDDFTAAFRRAAEKDIRPDWKGNRYLPVVMGNAGNQPPQRGQWAFCHAVYPGQLFAPDDPLVTGQLAMLRATEVEGLVLSTGWMINGLWTYFASFYAHALLWTGQSQAAVQSLYDFANHAAPTRVWREEQRPQGKGDKEVGDMPHNWASAEFIRLSIHLLAWERGRELHLLEGFPREWAAAGKISRLNGVLTPFGPLHFEVAVAADGRSARVKLTALKVAKPEKIVLHLAGLTGEARSVEIPVGEDFDQTFKW